MIFRTFADEILRKRAACPCEAAAALAKEEIMQSTLVIGDVHGSDLWQDIVAQRPECRVVFLGDYLDPREPLPRQVLLRNLENIIALKRARPDEVTLLLGNHDLHYFCEEAPIASRFDMDIAEDASRLFLDHFDLFQFARQEGRRLFTHAGVSQEWFERDFRGDPARPLDEQLNHPVGGQLEALMRVGEARGGQRGALGGIFWADRSELVDPLHGFDQFVGHNRVPRVIEAEGAHDNRVVYCDCLGEGLCLLLDD